MKRLLIGLALTLAVSPAWAQTRDQNWAECQKQNSDYDVSTGITEDPDIIIKACTALIQSGRETTEDLAVDYNNRAITYTLKAIPVGPYDQAIADSTKAIALNPNYADAYNTRAMAYQLGGKGAKGLSDASKSIALAPKNVSYIETQASIYEDLGQIKKAIADYRTILKIAPRSNSADRAQSSLKRLSVTP